MELKEQENREILISRYLSGEASSDEVVELKKWLDSYKDNLLYFSFRTKYDPIQQEPVYNELFAAFGTRSSLKLSDGTSVWLNSGSSIKYPDRFVGNERTVFLNGEAYFEVESNLEKPFIVETLSGLLSRMNLLMKS